MCYFDPDTKARRACGRWFLLAALLGCIDRVTGNAFRLTERACQRLTQPRTPLIARLLYRLSAHLPCRLIHRGDGSRYLERYAMPATIRRALKRIGITVYLHRFVAADCDEWVHDHPWRHSLAILLTGWYREERVQWWDPETGWKARERTIGGLRRLNLIRAQDFHRIREARPDTWTLFIHTQRIKGWGFLKHDRIPLRYVLDIDRGEMKPDQTFGQMIYSQPYNVAANANWEHSATTGAQVDRAAIMETLQ